MMMSWRTLATSRASSSRSPRSPRTCGGSRGSSRKATEHSLVLLDELGAGTDPAEGAALGRAILDELDSIGCRSIVTTHIGDLKSYAMTNRRAENAAVEFDVETLRPRYRLHIGDVGLSNALLIARRLSLPEHIVSRAEAYLQQRSSSQEPDWELVQQLRKEAEELRQSALQAQAEAQRTREALGQKLADLHARPGARTSWPRPGRGYSPAIGWSSRGSDTTARAVSSSSIPARRPRSSPSAT